MIGGGAPPPPSEVKVRTMKSDLASMAKSGGGMPSFENVAISGLTVEKEYTTPTHASSMATQPQPQPQLQPQPQIQPQPAISSTTSNPSSPAASMPQEPSQITPELGAPKKDIYPILIVALVAVLAVAGVGYFAYIIFSTGGSSQTPTTPAQQSASLPVVATTTTAAPSSTAAGVTPVVAASLSNELAAPHASLFTTPADQIITVDFTGTTSATYRKTVNTSLGAIKSASTIVEIDSTVADGNNLSLQGLLSVAGGSIFNTSTLANLRPDTTFFIYLDKNGLWPGYVIAVNPGQSTSSIAANIQQLESSSNIKNLYLTDPGTPSSDGFTDSATAGTIVRILPFTGLSIPSYFTYGWYKNYLIVSTSRNGFGAAIAKLH